MRITAIKHLRKRDRVSLTLDGGQEVEMAAEVVTRAGFGVGTDLDEAALGRMEKEDNAWRARETALRYLSHRQRSEVEITRRLLQGGYTPDIVEACIAQLRGAGLIDDADFARAYTRDRLRNRPGGRRELISKLRSRGIAGDDAAGAIDDVHAEGSLTELDLGRRAATKFRPRPGEVTVRIKNRLYGLLMRRGFTAEVASEVVAETVARIRGGNAEDDESSFEYELDV